MQTIVVHGLCTASMLPAQPFSPGGSASETITKTVFLGEQQRLYQDLSGPDWGRGVGVTVSLRQLHYKIDVMRVHTRDKKTDANLSKKATKEKKNR